MTPAPDQLRLLKRNRQRYFLPYYIEVVARHPEGILARDAKAEVRELLRQRFDLDFGDPSLSGLNPSTGSSRADQWANNLVSNDVLDDYMIVVRSTQATLFPGVADNSQTSSPSGSSLSSGQISELDARRPVMMPSDSSTSTYQRSIQLADHMRRLTKYACAISEPTCVPFDGRDGRPYVEVHHIVPMALQSHTTTNLDRVSNMVPLCPRCHLCLHRGSGAVASGVLDRVFDWFGSTYGRTFSVSNDDLGLPIEKADLLQMYGLIPT